MLGTRKITIDLRSQGASGYQTVYFYPQLAGGDGEVLLEKRYTATTAADGTAEINLPVKSSGALIYRCALPKDGGVSEFEFALTAGADIGLDALLAAGMTEISQPIYDYIDEQIASIPTGATGPAGGVLSGNYPNPGFAVNMVEQTELDSAVAALTGEIEDLESFLQDVEDSVSFLVTNGDGNSFLANDGTYKTIEAGGMAVGEPVAGATQRGVFFTDASGNLAQDASNFAYDPAKRTLLVDSAVMTPGETALRIDLTNGSPANYLAFTYESPDNIYAAFAQAPYGLNTKCAYNFSIETAASNGLIVGRSSSISDGATPFKALVQAGHVNQGAIGVYMADGQTADSFAVFQSNGAKLGGFRANGDLFMAQRTPASSSAEGLAGTVEIDANYIYVCTADDNWKQIPLDDF